MQSQTLRSDAPRSTGSEQPADVNSGGLRPWEMFVRDGPVMVTAIHAGHTIRPSLEPYLTIGEADRLREEDPLTDYFLPLGDTIVRGNRSRFECDLNRPVERCISTDPEETWGLKVWNGALPEAELAASHTLHSKFYAEIAQRVEAMIAAHGEVLVLDLHSYNHRRGSPNAKPAAQRDNPDIDLGATTLVHEVHGDLLKVFAQGLASRPVRGRTPDVQVNVRWKDGGHFPEWLHATYGAKACVITLEYKKIFMDEWTGATDLGALQDLREGFEAALAAARGWLAERA
jgi:N-formylglutamate deformylase